MFRYSPTENDLMLQKYVREQFGKELMLILDTKTRWNSLMFMLERFLELKDCIRKAVIDLNLTMNISDDEFTAISLIISIL